MQKQQRKQTIRQIPITRKISCQLKQLKPNEKEREEFKKGIKIEPLAGIFLGMKISTRATH